MLIRTIAGLILFFVTPRASGTAGDDQAKLIDYLFTDYEKDVRPICGDDEPIEVQIGIAIRQIIELDEPKQILYVNAWLRLTWFNCHLQWNASEYSNIDNLIVPYAKVWSPDITLYDNAGEELEGIKDYLVNVQSTGICHYNFPTVIKSLCRIDVTYFPFDTQKCPLKFGSWSYHGLDINSTSKDAEGDISAFVENTEWELLGVPLKRSVLYYQCCSEPYPDITFHVTMKRKPLFYVLNLLFPCMLITCVALLGFMLPPDAGEKVSLEITVLLSLAVFLLVVSETLPASSENFPYIGIYFAVAMMLVSLSTLLTVVVLNYHHKGNLNRPVPDWIRKVVFQYLSRFMLVKMDSRSIHPESSHVQEGKGRATGFENNAFHQETYINGYQDFTNKEHSHCNGNGAVNVIPLESEFSERPLSLTPIPSDIPATNTNVSTHSSMLPLLGILRQQLKLMEKDDARKVSKHTHDHLSSEWKKVGIILDRFFLLVFALIMVISSLAILLQLSA